MLCREYFACGAIEHVENAVPVRVKQNLPSCALPRHVEQNVFVDAVMVEEIMRIHLIGPACSARVRIARENRRRPFVIARPEIWVPRAGIAAAVIDEVEIRIV